MADGKKDIIDVEALEAAQLNEGHLAYLKAEGVRTLPNNPTASAWNAEAIKKQMYHQSEILFDWLRQIGNTTSEALENINNYLTVYSQGPKGDQGEKGDQGPQGIQGPIGPVGPQGAQGPQGEQGPKGDKGDPFSVAKIYSSVEEMNAGYATDGVPIGGFVMINTGNVEQADNAKLYCKGSTAYQYITDMSGSKGIQGPQGPTGPQGEIGPQGPTGPQGPVGPQGERGPQGEAGPTAQFAINDKGELVATY